MRVYYQMPDSGNTTDSGGRKDAVINLKVRPERKENWQSIAAEEFDNLSQMIRQAVSQVHESDDTDGEAPTGVATEEKANEILSQVRSLEKQLQQLQTTVDAVAERTKKTPKSVKDLANEVFGALPTETELEEWHNIAAESGRPVGEHGPPKSHSGSAADIAAEIGEKEVDVQKALEHLQDTTHRVQTTEKRNEVRWYKEV